MPLTKTDLPEFDAPPLQEVFLGIQFRTPSKFDPIKAYEVWQLFAAQFPTTSVQPPMDPQFETFGPRSFMPQINFGPIQFTMVRHWFESATGDQLIQFQPDRLFHNWRKMQPDRVDYPRFEKIIIQYAAELRALESYYQALGNERLFVTQCELAYHNNIVQDPNSVSQGVKPQAWFSFISGGQWPMERFGFNAARVMSRKGDPYGRFYRESAMGVDRFGRPVVTFNLTARGLPKTDDVAGALDFMREHRYIIAREFVDGTTKAAHRVWKRRS